MLKLLVSPHGSTVLHFFPPFIWRTPANCALKLLWWWLKMHLLHFWWFTGSFHKTIRPTAFNSRASTECRFQMRVSVLFSILFQEKCFCWVHLSHCINMQRKRCKTSDFPVCMKSCAKPFKDLHLENLQTHISCPVATQRSQTGPVRTSLSLTVLRTWLLDVLLSLPECMWLVWRIVRKVSGNIKPSACTKTVWCHLNSPVSTLTHQNNGEQLKVPRRFRPIWSSAATIDSTQTANHLLPTNCKTRVFKNSDFSLYMRRYAIVILRVYRGREYQIASRVYFFQSRATGVRVQ